MVRGEFSVQAAASTEQWSCPSPAVCRVISHQHRMHYYLSYNGSGIFRYIFLSLTFSLLLRQMFKLKAGLYFHYEVSESIRAPGTCCHCPTPFFPCPLLGRDGDRAAHGRQAAGRSPHRGCTPGRRPRCTWQDVRCPCGSAGALSSPLQGRQVCVLPG